MAKTSNRRRDLLAAALLAVTAPVARAAADWFLPWRWRARLLIIFAPNEADPALQAQRSLLSPASAASAERNLVSMEVIGEHCSDSRVKGSALRLVFGVPVSTFCVILVGKDGGEKMRVDQPIAMQAVFATIDAMPMGRAEAARRAVP